MGHCDPYGEHPRYTSVDNWVYEPIISSFNVWKNVTLNNSSTSDNEFYDIHMIIIDVISSYMWYVVTNGDLGVASTDDIKEGVYYIANFNFDPYTLQEDVSIDGRIIAMRKQVVNDFYPRHLIQGYKFYTEPLYSKTKPTIMEIKTVVHPQIYDDILWWRVKIYNAHI